MIDQGELPLRNNSAATADWIGRTKGRVIYAYDLGALLTAATEGPIFTREDFEQAPERVGRRQPTSSEPDQPSP